MIVYKKKHHARYVCQFVLYNGESRNSNYVDLLWVPRTTGWELKLTECGGGDTSSKNSLESPLIYIYIYIYIYMLYIDLRPGQTCHSKVMHRKEVTHSDGSYGKKSRRRAWLTIWDKVKSHGTLIDWCIGREWPVNCMTVTSAWWRSNMLFQRLSGRLNYYITQWDRKSESLETRWVRDNMW